MNSAGNSFVVFRVSGRLDSDLSEATMGSKREHPRYGYRFSAIVRELSPFTFHNQLSPFCPYPIETARILTLPYGERRSRKPAYSYGELCRFPKVWDAPQGPLREPSIPEKASISWSMTGV